MSRIMHWLHSFLKVFDLFPTTQFLRYKEEADYKTATGGFVSIVLIVICVILFYGLGMQTVNREIINGSVNYQIDVQPKALTVNFQPGGGFMFAVGIMGFDLNDPNTALFEISLRQNYFSPVFQTINSTLVPLVPCTPSHFSYDADISSLYKQLNFSQSLCPPLDYDFIVSGRTSSSVFAEFSVYIEYCNSTINSKCLPLAVVQAIEKSIGGFTLVVPVISTIVNPGNQNYKQVYIEDQNYFFFTTTNGLWLDGQIQEYQVDTDNSLMPYTDISTEYITTIPNLFSAKARPAPTGHYVQLMFTKSSTTTTYARSFNKVDDYFSYVGGLLGTTLLFFFILSSYSEKSYAISIAAQHFTLLEDSGSPPKFNFFYYLAIYIKKGLNHLNKNLRWGNSDLFLSALQEMEKQLSIQYLLNRFNYFEEAISSILDEHQLEILYLNDRKTISAGEALRKKYNLPQRMSSRVHSKQIEMKVNDSSSNMITSSLHENNGSKVSNTFEEVPKLSRLELINAEIGNSSESGEEAHKKLKGNLIQVINESNLGNPISRRILGKVNRKVFPQIGVDLSQAKERKSYRLNDQLEVNHDELKQSNAECFQFNESS